MILASQKFFPSRYPRGFPKLHKFTRFKLHFMVVLLLLKPSPALVEVSWPTFRRGGLVPGGNAVFRPPIYNVNRSPKTSLR